ncbi:MAG: Ig-like domain-containing protein [Balneolaceae bacterium]
MSNYLPSFRSILPCLFSLILLFHFTPQSANAQEVTGLDGWSIFLDPGHSQTENMGLYNYSEPEKVLRIGLALREMLLTQTDIDTVYMSRTSDTQQVGLSQRTILANTLAPDFYYSIHSNAGSNTTNNTLMLHGGWRSNGQTVEKTPPGGKLMGDHMIDDLTASMRIPTIGNYADRTFYQGTPYNHANQFPYLAVNRTTDMASVLSEGGFHTNPTQQQRNLNAEWKRLEAQSAFWSILKYHEADKPVVGIATGYITDEESGTLLNEITVTIDDQSYTTDSYESLFNQFSNNPDALRNGFYYIEGLPNGTAEITVEGPGYYADTFEVDIINDNFTFKDITLISTVPPFVESTYPTEADTTLNPSEEIVIRFSRAMDRESVEGAFSASEDFEGTISWANDSQMRITTDSLDFETEYSISIDSTAFDKTEFAHAFDADGDGTSGGVFTLNFKTGPEDFMPPALVNHYPSSIKKSEVLPIVTAEFDELLDEATIDEASITLTQSSYQVPGTVKHYEVNEKSVLQFFPSENLTPNKNYTFTISGDLADVNGNAIGSNITRSFPTGDKDIDDVVSIDNFNSGVDNWWQPSQSGSTAAYIAEETGRSADSDIVNILTNSSSSLRVDYGWDASSSGHLIREYTPRTSPTFNDTHTLQAYVFGDGNGNKMRFVVRDGNNELEASDWTTVDWTGWKLVSWNLSEDNVTGWANGDGTLNGSMHIDSFQLTYTPGQPSTGFINFDDLRAVTFGEATSIDDEIFSDVPNSISLEQNYPNPFNPSTNIKFGLPERSDVNLEVYDMLGRKVATILSGPKSAGFHTISFDASQLSSGVYLYRLAIGSEIISRKMLLMK